MERADGVLAAMRAEVTTRGKVRVFGNASPKLLRPDRTFLRDAMRIMGGATSTAEHDAFLSAEQRDLGLARAFNGLQDGDVVRVAQEAVIEWIATESKVRHNGHPPFMTTKTVKPVARRWAFASNSDIWPLPNGGDDDNIRFSAAAKTAVQITTQNEVRLLAYAASQHHLSPRFQHKFAAPLNEEHGLAGIEYWELNVSGDVDAGAELQFGIAPPEWPCDEATVMKVDNITFVCRAVDKGTADWPVVDLIARDTKGFGAAPLRDIAEEIGLTPSAAETLSDKGFRTGEDFVTLFTERGREALVAQLKTSGIKKIGSPWISKLLKLVKNHIKESNSIAGTRLASCEWDDTDHEWNFGNEHPELLSDSGLTEFVRWMAAPPGAQKAAWDHKYHMFTVPRSTPPTKTWGMLLVHGYGTGTLTVYADGKLDRQHNDITYKSRLVPCVSVRKAQGAIITISCPHSIPPLQTRLTNTDIYDILCVRLPNSKDKPKRNLLLWRGRLMRYALQNLLHPQKGDPWADKFAVFRKQWAPVAANVHRELGPNGLDRLDEGGRVFAFMSPVIFGIAHAPASAVPAAFNTLVEQIKLVRTIRDESSPDDVPRVPRGDTLRVFNNEHESGHIQDKMLQKLESCMQGMCKGTEYVYSHDYRTGLTDARVRGPGILNLQEIVEKVEGGIARHNVMLPDVSVDKALLFWDGRTCHPVMPERIVREDPLLPLRPYTFACYFSFAAYNDDNDDVMEVQSPATSSDEEDDEIQITAVINGDEGKGNERKNREDIDSLVERIKVNLGFGLDLDDTTDAKVKKTLTCKYVGDWDNVEYFRDVLDALQSSSRSRDDGGAAAQMTEASDDDDGGAAAQMTEASVRRHENGYQFPAVEKTLSSEHNLTRATFRTLLHAEIDKEPTLMAAEKTRIGEAVESAITASIANSVRYRRIVCIESPVRSFNRRSADAKMGIEAILSALCRDEKEKAEYLDDDVAIMRQRHIYTLGEWVAICHRPSEWKRPEWKDLHLYARALDVGCNTRFVDDGDTIELGEELRLFDIGVLWKSRLHNTTRDISSFVTRLFKLSDLRKWWKPLRAACQHIPGYYVAATGAHVHQRAPKVSRVLVPIYIPRHIVFGIVTLEHYAMHTIRKSFEVVDNNYYGSTITAKRHVVECGELWTNVCKTGISPTPATFSVTQLLRLQDDGYVGNPTTGNDGGNCWNHTVLLMMMFVCNRWTTGEEIATLCNGSPYSNKTRTFYALYRYLYHYLLKLEIVIFEVMHNAEATLYNYWIDLAELETNPNVYRAYLNAHKGGIPFDYYIKYLIRVNKELPWNEADIRPSMDAQLEELKRAMQMREKILDKLPSMQCDGADVLIDRLCTYNSTQGLADAVTLLIALFASKKRLAAAAVAKLCELDDWDELRSRPDGVGQPFTIGNIVDACIFRVSPLLLKSEALPVDAPCTYALSTLLDAVYLQIASAPVDRSYTFIVKTTSGRTTLADGSDTENFARDDLSMDRCRSGSGCITRAVKMAVDARTTNIYYFDEVVSEHYTLIFSRTAPEAGQHVWRYQTHMRHQIPSFLLSVLKQDTLSTDRTKRRRLDQKGDDLREFLQPFYEKAPTGALADDCSILAVHDVRTKSDLEELQDGLGKEGFHHQMQSWGITHIMRMDRIAKLFSTASPSYEQLFGAIKMFLNTNDTSTITVKDVLRHLSTAVFPNGDLGNRKADIKQAIDSIIDSEESSPSYEQLVGAIKKFFNANDTSTITVKDVLRHLSTAVFPNGDLGNRKAEIKQAIDSIIDSEES